MFDLQQSWQTLTSTLTSMAPSNRSMCVVLMGKILQKMELRMPAAMRKQGLDGHVAVRSRSDWAQAAPADGTRPSVATPVSGVSWQTSLPDNEGIWSNTNTRFMRSYYCLGHHRNSQLSAFRPSTTYVVADHQ